MKRYELIRSILPGTGIISLDLSKDDQYKLVSDLFGGTGYMREKLPILSALVNETREQHVREGGPHYKTVLQLTEAPTDFVDGIYIDHVIYDNTNKCVKVKASVSLTEEAYWIDSKVEIYTEAGEYVNTYYQTAEECHYQRIEYTVEGIDMSHFQSQVLVTTLQTSWQPVNSKMLRSQLITRQTYTNSAIAVAELRVDDPRNINTQPGENIYVVYGRTPGSKETVDYDYPCQSDGGYSQHLFLDVKGSAILAGSHQFDKILPQNFYLLLDCSYGCAPYMNGLGNRINATADGFEWTLNNDWKTSVPTPSGEHKGVAFRLSMDFLCQGEAYPYSLYIASDLDDELAQYPNYQKIPFLTILWGCLARGSKIRMADGSTVSIEDIRIGDRVMNPYGGGAATVVNTWKGSEKILRHIETQGGYSVEASDTHPLMTEKGAVEAGKIVEGDQLLTAEGTYEIVSVQYPIHYDDEVFNLELECPACDETWKAHTMVCNGLVVGDNYLQNNLADANEEPQPIPIPDALKKELELVRQLRETEKR